MDEARNKGNLVVMDELIAPTFVDHEPANPFSQDRDGYRENVMHFRTAFPDAHFTADAFLAEENTVALRYVFGDASGRYC